MKTILDNRVAEFINMEGRRGEKLAFGRLELCTIIIGIMNKNILPVTLTFSINAVFILDLHRVNAI